MADERDLPPQQDAPDDDFGGFLGRRLRSYQSGVLGLGSLRDVPVPAAAEHGANVVSRSAEFAGSLQSLLSYRAANDAPAPPPLAREVDRSIAAPAPPPQANNEETSEAGEEPAPTGPIAFGSETWFARMAQRIAATEQRQRAAAPIVTGRQPPRSRPPSASTARRRRLGRTVRSGAGR